MHSGALQYLPITLPFFAALASVLAIRLAVAATMEGAAVESTAMEGTMMFGFFQPLDIPKREPYRNGVAEKRELVRVVVE